MNILHIDTETSWRGGENQVDLLVEGLAKKNVKNFLAFPKNSIGFLHFRNKGYATFELNLGLLHIWLLTKKLQDFCVQENIDIVHAHTSGAHTIALKLKRQCPQLKLVVHRRVAFNKNIKSLRKKKYSNPLVDHYIAISKAVESSLHDLGVEHHRITRVYSAIDFSRFKKFSEKELLLGSKNEKLFLGTASALTPEKGLFVLVDAIENLKKDHLNFKLFIAGSGELESDLKKAVIAKKLDHHIEFLGSVKDIPQYLSELDIFVMPSLFEGLGTAAIEAMGAHCCVVSSDAGGLPEIVVHEETGLLAKAGEVSSLTRQLKRVIEDPTLRNKLAKCGHSRAQEIFSVNPMVESIYGTYCSLKAEHA